MTIVMIEATAEELSANRTVMDCVNDTLNRFTDRICGVSNIDYSKEMENLARQEESEDSD